MKIFVMLFFLILPLTTFAQGGGGNVGNGGGGNEPEFKSLSSILKQWIQMGALNLDQRFIPKKVNWKDVLDAIDQVPVQFTDRELKVDDSTPRACVNHPHADAALRFIECNNQAWGLIPDEQKLAVVFHEYLGILGYESNSGKFSNYRLSSQLIDVHSSTSAESKTDGITAHLKSANRQAVEIRAVPASVMKWIRSLMGRYAVLDIRQDGTFSMSNQAHGKMAESLFRGAYLQNDDYRIEGQVASQFSSKIGNESFRISQPIILDRPNYVFVMIWSEHAGIQSIEASSNMMMAYVIGAPKVTESRLNADGSVTIFKGDAGDRSVAPKIKLRVNGVGYLNRYVSPSRMEP